MGKIDTEEVKKTIKVFRDLKAWQTGHEIVLDVYRITQRFPKEEMFGLSSQMKRCGVSITSNIAEGFSRASIKDKTHFYIMAQGSVTELQNQIIVAKDVGFISEEVYNSLYEKTITLHKILNGLIKSTRNNSFSLNS